MKKIIYILVASLLVSCNFFKSSSPEMTEEPPVITEDEVIQEDTEDDYIPNIPDGVKDIAFKREKGEAILIGQMIATYDKKGKFLEYRTDIDRKFVTIKAISELMYNETEDFCEEYYFVKAELANGEPLILDGRRVYKLQEKPFEKVFDPSQAIRIYRTEYYGQPFFTDELTGCGSPFDPVVLVSIDGFKGLVTLHKNDFALEAFGYNHPSRKKVDFFELADNDGFGDKVKKAEQTPKGIVLAIHRDFQEGYTDYKVLITKEKDTYSAVYLDFPETKYDE